MITNYKSAKITHQHIFVLKQLNLPIEIINIIKDMAYDDETTHNSKKYKNTFVSLLKNSVYKNEILLYNMMNTAIISSSSMIIKNNDKTIYIKSIYCLKCGEEIWQTYLNIQDIRCLCNDTHLSLLDYSSNDKYKKNINKLSIVLSFILSGIISYFITRVILNFIIFINS